MQVSVENTGNLSRKMNITVPAGDIAKMAEERLAEVAKTIKMDGFRPGKVPLNVVKKQHGAAVYNEVTERVISESLQKAFTEQEIQPAGQPVMDPSAGLPTEGEDYSFAVTFDIYPEITPADFSKIKLTKSTAEATDAMVDELLGRLKTARQDFAKKDGAAEMGDRVVMNAEGYLEGEDKPFDNSQLTDFQLVLGSGQLIPGFEDGLVGVKAGEKRDVEVKFPESYHAKDLAGKPATFKCDVTEVQAAKEAEVNDEFAKNFGAETAEELMNKIREQINSDLTNATEQKLKKDLFDALDEANKFDLPESVIEQEFNSIWNAQKQDLERQGLSMDSMDKSEDELKTEYRELARRRVALGLLLAEIGKQEEIKVEKEDVDAEIAKVSSANPGMEAQVQQYYADPNNQQQLVGPLFEQKVTAHILSKAKVEEKAVDADALLQELGQA